MVEVRNDAEVLIIGAGMAGITTGWALRNLGIRSIILEARPIVGGRVHTSYAWSDAPVDLGASWVSHAALLNPLVDIARDNGIRLTKSDITNVHLDGVADDERDVMMSLFFAAYAEVKREAQRRRNRGRRDVAVSDVFPAVIDAMKLKKPVRRGVEYFLNMSVTEPYATDLDDLSLYNWDDDLTLLSQLLYVVPDGYVKIPQLLAKKLDIRLEHVVSRIKHDKDGVTVKTNRGDFTAPHAVVTLPHAILRNNGVKFSPELPNWKREAINRIHTGLSDKFWFRFPKKFWKSNADILGRIDPDGQGRWSTWINGYKFTKLPILMVFNRSEHAAALEQMSDEEVIAEAMQVLRATFGPKVPDPVAMQRSRWLADPYAQGTLAHVPPGASSEDHRTLGKPVGRLRFAGDSTNADVPGTVLGAFYSGVREAGQLAGLCAMERKRAD